MSAESEIQKKIDYFQRACENAAQENREIDAKIKSLQNALNWAKRAEKKAELLENSIKNFKVSSQWVKGYREQFNAALRETLKSTTVAYENDVQSLCWDIQREIWRLESEKNHFISLISSAEKNINKAFKQLNKLFAD